MERTDRAEFYGVYDVHINHNTKNFGGCEWIVDGENGRLNYPGSWTKEEAVEAYRRGGIYNPKPGEGISISNFVGW